MLPSNQNFFASIDLKGDEQTHIFYCFIYLNQFDKVDKVDSGISQ